MPLNSAVKGEGSVTISSGGKNYSSCGSGNFPAVGSQCKVHIKFSHQLRGIGLHAKPCLFGVYRCHEQRGIAASPGTLGINGVNDYVANDVPGNSVIGPSLKGSKDIIPPHGEVFRIRRPGKGAIYSKQRAGGLEVEGVIVMVIEINQLRAGQFNGLL